MLKRTWVLILCCLVSVSGAYAQDTASFGSDLSMMFGNLGGILKTNLDSNSILGTPVQVGEVTLVPIIMKGFGMGLGEGANLQGESHSADKGSAESEKNRKGIGGGLGGFARPVAIIVVKKDGSLQIHRILPESWIAQGIQALVPVFQNMINKRFEVKMRNMDHPPAGQPAPPPGK